MVKQSTCICILVNIQYISERNLHLYSNKLLYPMLIKRSSTVNCAKSHITSGYKKYRTSSNGKRATFLTKHSLHSYNIRFYFNQRISKQFLRDHE